MATFHTKDGTEIYYNSWEIGQPVVFASARLSAKLAKDQVNADLMAFIKSGEAKRTQSGSRAPGQPRSVAALGRERQS